MWTCPVCKTEKIEDDACPRCQYHLSDNFEQFPTLIPLPGTVQALSKRRAKWLAARREEVLTCSACGGTSFAILLQQRCYRCTQCGARVDVGAVWKGASPATDMISAPRSAIAAGIFFTAAITKRKKLLITDLKRYSDVGMWEKIVSVAAGDYHILGLKEDGTVIATGWKNKAACNTDNWKNIVSISAGSNHSAGLTADGTVVVTDSTQTQTVKHWKNVVAVAAGGNLTLALFGNGDVGICRRYCYGDDEFNVSDWHNIVAISAGDNHAVGIQTDGTVVSTGWNGRGQCNVHAWKDITAVAAGLNHTVGLHKDGTVVATGSNDEGQCNVGQWTQIIAIAARNCHTVGLRADGTIVATGANDYGQCNAKKWKDILTIGAEAPQEIDEEDCLRE